MFETLRGGFDRLPSLGAFRRLPPRARREAKSGYAFIGLWIFGFVVFVFLPIIASLIFSFLDLRITDGILSSPNFVGLKNYITMVNDSQIWSNTGGTPGSMWVTVRFGLIALPVGILLPLGIALLVNNRFLLGKTVVRSLFYMPYIIPFIAAVFLWGGMLNSESGWINRALIAMGVARDAVPLWANSLTWVYPTYVIMGIWGIGNAMLILLAGLQNVPTELYDAAKIDGAGNWATFRKITFPMISPIVFYILVLNVVGLFQYFLVPLVVNQGTGRPGGATYFFNLYLYRTFFTFQNMGYGSALAWLLFALILVVTLFLFGTMRFWVYYAGESRSD